MRKRYFKNKIVSDTIPLYILTNTINLHTLILLKNDKINDNLLQHLPTLKHLKLPMNNKITDIGLKYISLVTNLDLRWNTNITLSHIIMLCIII